MDNPKEEVKEAANDLNKGIDKELMKRLIKAYRDKQNKSKLPKELIYKREKIKKAKRRESNKSRKINQEKNRHNKFTK